MLFVGLYKGPSKIEEVGFVLEDPPVIDALLYIGASHLNEVPEGINPSTPFVGVITKEVPVQTDLKIVLREGPGLINIVTVNCAPVQVPKVGVTR